MGVSRKRLTGRIKYRVNVFGSVVLQVEETAHYVDDRDPLDWQGHEFTVWRDAKGGDLQYAKDFKPLS